MLLSDLQAKDIINIKNGDNLGRIVDAKVDSSGKVLYFVAEERKIMRKFSHGARDSEITFKFEQIKKIGEDVILIEL